MIFKLNYLTPDIHKKLFSDITEFRTSFGLTINAPCSCGMSNDDDALHTSLFIEELSELVTSRSLADAADALIDSAYVLVGREVQLGEYIPEIEVIVDALIAVCSKNGIPFVKVWEIIHASNMSKLSKNVADFEETEGYYKRLGVPTVGEQQPNGMIAVKCSENTKYVDDKGVEKTIKKGKVLKSVNYTSADEQIALIFA